MSHTAYARAAVLSHYLEVAEKLKLNPVPLLRNVGLSKSLLTNPDQKIPITAAVDLLEESARVSGCSGFGLLIADARSISDMGPISLLLSHQRTLRDALYTIGQYRHLLNESLGMYVEDAGKTTLIHEEVVTESTHPARQAIELAVGVMCNICRTLTSPQWKPLSVNFIHAAPDDLTLHRRIFRANIQFKSDFNGLTCATADLDRPNPLADPVMAKYAQSFMDSLPKNGQSDLRQEIRKSIYLLLPIGRANIEHIANSLGLNVRTIQRKLEEHNESFSNLVDQVRKELANRYLLNTQYPLGRVAQQLGYSNPSSFTRWFLSQHGVTPSAFRDRDSNKSGGAKSVKDYSHPQPTN